MTEEVAMVNLNLNYHIVEHGRPTAGRLLDWPRPRGLIGETSDESKGPWRGNGPKMIVRPDVLHHENEHVREQDTDRWLLHKAAAEMGVGEEIVNHCA
jgi:hypothetical protein